MVKGQRGSCGLLDTKSQQTNRDYWGTVEE